MAGWLAGWMADCRLSHLPRMLNSQASPELLLFGLQDNGLSHLSPRAKDMLLMFSQEENLFLCARGEKFIWRNNFIVSFQCLHMSTHVRKPTETQALQHFSPFLIGTTLLNMHVASEMNEKLILYQYLNNNKNTRGGSVEKRWLRNYIKTNGTLKRPSFLVTFDRLHGRAFNTSYLAVKW